MGQRHQLFFIARLLHKDSTQPRYRCVAAAHHQWLYGRTALHACKAILELLRNKENAEIAREELATIAAAYSRKEELPSFAAPFLSWLFIGALRLRLEEEYVSGSSDMLDANMGSHEGDNNDGITVFDVTNPLDPAYCFVSIFGLESARQTVELDVPLTAEQYVREYYPPPPPSPQNDEVGRKEPKSDDTSQKDEDRKLSQAEMEAQVESEVLKLIKSFVDERLVERWMLHEAWPYEGYGPPTGRSTPQTCDSAPLDGPEHYSVLPTLSELSLRKAIDLAQEYGYISGLEVALSLPGIGAPHILRTLAKLNHYSDATLEIIVKALRDARSNESASFDSLDLSPYALTPDQIVKVSASFPHTQMLKLSGNPNVDGQTLSRLPQELPTLSRLNVYNCDAFSPSDIDAVLSSATHLEVVYHRKSMINDLGVFHEEEPFSDVAPPKVTRNNAPPAFTFCVQNLKNFSDDDLGGYSLKSYSPRQIVVCLDDFHGSLQWSGYYNQHFNINLPVILSGLPRPPHVSFKDRVLGPIPGKQSLAIEGWLYVMVLKKQTGVRRFLDPPSTGFLVGFVKYRFANSKEVCDEGSSNAKDCARPPPESVEVMGLAEWLQKVDPDQTVEGEWVERLEGKLKDFQLISKERAIELMKDIPMYTE